MQEVIDLGAAARAAGERAKAATEGRPAPVSPQEHPAWHVFEQEMTKLKALGKLPIVKVRNILWGGFRAGFEACANQVSQSFQTGNFTMEGHPPAWWTELRDLTTAFIEEYDASHPEDHSEALENIRFHLESGQVETDDDAPLVDVPHEDDDPDTGLNALAEQEPSVE